MSLAFSIALAHIAQGSRLIYISQSINLQLFKNNEAIGTIGAKAIDIDVLKEKYIAQVNTQCYNILCDTDWYVIKHTELGTEIPSKIKTFRASIRTKANELETSINACSSIDDFKTILDRTDPDSAAPIEDWPELEEE